ncbi:MAG: mechanosensitive ion channel family protein [Clostridiales bacterium]|jgi:small conductance mechanosensitive channel|nr:mechanosensitive ion channel family protein [Clostridiales bacterium]
MIQGVTSLLQLFSGSDLIGFLNIDAAQTSPMLKAVIGVAAIIIQCVLIVGIALILSFLLRKAIGKFFRLPGRVSAKSETLSSVFSNFVKYGIGFLAVCEILTLFGVAVESILAVAGIGSVAIGFGAQTIVKDVLTGVFILLENQYNVGEIVRINGLSGVIESVGIRTTKIRDNNGNLHILPNSTIGAVTNISRDYQRPIITLEFGATHSVDNILNMLSDEMSKVGSLPGLTKPPEVQGLVALSPASFKVQIEAECESNYCWPIERELRRRIKLRFEKENIS